jgi:hypothetical protein
MILLSFKENLIQIVFIALRGVYSPGFPGVAFPLGYSRLRNGPFINFFKSHFPTRYV